MLRMLILHRKPTCCVHILDFFPLTCSSCPLSLQTAASELEPHLSLTSLPAHSSGMEKTRRNQCVVHVGPYEDPTLTGVKVWVIISSKLHVSQDPDPPGSAQCDNSVHMYILSKYNKMLKFVKLNKAISTNKRLLVNAVEKWNVLLIIPSWLWRGKQILPPLPVSSALLCNYSNHYREDERERDRVRLSHLFAVGEGSFYYKCTSTQLVTGRSDRKR